MAICYILYSHTINKFYVGATRTTVDERLHKHNTAFYGTHFTSKSDDWEVFLTITCESYRQALSIERHIKQMKSKTYIRNLKKYKELIEKLLTKYKP